MTGKSLPRKMMPALLVMVFALSTAAVTQSAHAITNKVLILGTSVYNNSATGGMEQTAAQNLGFAADVVTPSQWGALTKSDFASYAAIIFGDPDCGSASSSSYIGAAEANVATWAPAVSGNIIVIGTDPVYHYLNGQPQAKTLIDNGVAFATSSPGFTGAYIDLSCYYRTAAPKTSVPVLSGFGNFTATGAGCGDSVHIVLPTHPAMNGLTDAGLSNWNCSIHEVLDTADPSFTTLALDQQMALPEIMARTPVGAVTNVALSADRTSIGSASNVPLYTIPLNKVPGLTNAFGSTQMGKIKMGSTPIGTIPIGTIPIGTIGLDSIDSHEFDGVVLSSISLDWAPILKGTKFDGLSLQTISLGDVLSDPTAKQNFMAAAQKATLSQFGFSRSLLRGISVATVVLGPITASSIPPPGGATSWCALFATKNYTCPAGTDETKESLLGFDIQGAPIGTIPIGTILISSVPQTGPISAVSLSSIPLAGKLGKIALSSLTNAGAVVDCSKVDCSAAGGKNLHDALASGAILASAQIKNLAGSFGDITLGDVLVELLANSDYPWESMPLPDILSAANGPAVGYTASFDLSCITGLDVHTTVTAPPGFNYVPGSAAFSYDGSVAKTLLDPIITNQQLSWHGVPGSPCGGGTGPDSTSSGTGVHNVHLVYAMRPAASLGTYASSITVNANSVAVTKDGAAPVVVTDTSDPDNTPSTAQAIQMDTLVMSHIAYSGDEAFFTIPAPSGRAHVYFSLSHIPSGQDFDLMVYAPKQKPVQSAPIGTIPIGTIPAQDSGSDTHGGTDGRQSPETNNDVQVAPVAGLGSPSAVSAGRGNVDEKIDYISSGVSGNITIRVTGYNGAYSSDPFVLRVWSSGPPPLPPAPARVLPFDSDPWHGTDESATTGQLPATVSPDTQSLLLINKDRMIDQFGSAPVNDMITNANLVAARPDVKGAVLPVDGSSAVRDAFETWDNDPNSTAKANDVVRAINDVVNTYRTSLPNLKHIVLFGTDEVFPFQRVTDGTTISNEIDEAHDLSFITKGLTASNATYAAAAQGNILTNDGYGTFTQYKWLDHDLPLPDVSVSRMVETPADISGQLKAFIAANGVVDPQSALVTGYDFLRGGASAIANQLRNRTSSVNEINNDTWSRADLLAAFTNATPVPDISSVNAHYSHNLAEPANTPDRSGLVSTQDVPAPPATGLPAFANRILFTIGCHAGLNVADTLIPNPTSDEIKLLKDWSQTWAGQTAASYVANTGFGYADSESLALSARLADLFAKHLNDPGLSLGEMLVKAKHDYFESAGNYGAFDEKALIEFSMYGVPFWHIGVGTSTPSTPSITTTPDAVTGLQTASISVTPTLTRHDATRGTFWSGAAGVHTMQYRPVLPLETRDVSNSGTSAHGAILTGLVTNDVAITQPYLFRPTIDSSAHEPATGTADQVYPANVLSIERSRAFNQESSTLNLISGQYRGSQGTAGSNVMRLIASAQASVAYDSSTASFDPPSILEFHVTQLSPTSVRLFGRAADASGVKRFAVLYHSISTNVWSYLELSPVSGTDGWAAVITVPSGDQVEAIGQAQDAHGNVTRTTNKGLLYPAVATTSVPDVHIETPAAGVTYPKGSTVNAKYFCSDAGSGITSCTGDAANGSPIDTSTYGRHVFHVTATNGAGVSVTATVGYFIGNPLPTQPPDTTAPQSQFGAGRDVLIESGIVNDSVSGRTTDDQSGVASVQVIYTPTLGGSPFTTSPSLTCSSDQLECVWKAAAPIVPGRYLIRAVAKDRAGNLEAPGPQRMVTVI